VLSVGCMFHFIYSLDILTTSPSLLVFITTTYIYLGCKNYLEYIRNYIDKWLFSLYIIIMVWYFLHCIILHQREHMQASFLFLLSKKKICKPARRQPKNLLTSNANPSSHRRLPSSPVFGNSLLLAGSTNQISAPSWFMYVRIQVCNLYIIGPIMSSKNCISTAMDIWPIYILGPTRESPCVWSAV